jgi:glutamate--cysteine ligase
VRWMGIGFHPFAKREDLPWVPKERYKLMREYLPTRGAHALDMMLRTSTVQANYDYTDEKDALLKMRVALKLSPLTAAMFANSPWVEGKAYGGLSYRASVWLDVDNDRSGLVPAVWKEDAGYKDYVEWALDVPMFLFKRNGEVFANTGQPFRKFWKEGFKGHKPNQTDWQTHLNTLFPEVRLKKTIEVRSADAQNASVACSLPALWTGIFYDKKALADADAMTRDWKYDEVQAIRTDVHMLGLKAKFRGEKLATQALQLLDIADGGLERRAKMNPKGKDERVHTAPLRRLAEKDMTPAEALLARIDPTKDLKPQVLAITDLEKPA